MQIGKAERLFDQHRRLLLCCLTLAELTAAQRDRRNTERRAILPKTGIGTKAQHQVAHHHVDRHCSQRCGCFDTVRAKLDGMSAIGENAGDKLANAPIRFGQEDSCHRAYL